MRSPLTAPATITVLAFAGMLSNATAQTATGGGKPAGGVAAGVTSTGGKPAGGATAGVATTGGRPAGGAAAGETSTGGKPADVAKTESKPCQPESQQVAMESADIGWVVLRVACPNEKAAVLSYSYGDTSKVVEGKLADGSWAFGIAEKIPDDAVIKLQFRVLLDSGDAKAVQAKLSDFASKLRDTVKASYDESVAKTKGTPPSDRWSVLLPVFMAEARSKVTALAKVTELPYFADKIPAVEFILQKGHFQKLPNSDWEPTPEILHDLENAGGPVAQELWNARAKVKDYNPTPAPACLSGDKQSIESGTKDARDKALANCLKALIVSADHLQVAKNDVATLKPLASLSDANIAKKIVNLPDVDAASKQGAESGLFLPPYAGAVENISMALPEILHEKSKTRLEDAKTALGAWEALDFVAAREVIDQIGPAWQKKLDNPVLPDITEVLQAITITREAQASQLFRKRPALPRFFLSTGVAVTSLDNTPGKDPNKLSIPILASICWSSSGCQTKGVGSGMGVFTYLSADLGVKLAFLGEKNPRESSPSFLAGLGVTPIYATHLSIGINAFDNPQTKRVNVAPYLSITLDLVNGADILGALGMGKPSVEPIGSSKPEGGSK